MYLSRVLSLDVGKKRKNRDSLEIVRDMLSFATVKVRKTRIMYQANLSFRQTEKYLTSLLENGLLECDVDSFYLITWKGKEFLQMYDDYVERLGRIGEEVKGARKDRLLLENICFNNEYKWKRMAREKDVPVDIGRA